MKTTSIFLPTTALLLVLTGLPMVANAVPVPIDGIVSFTGSATMDGTGFTTATKFLNFAGVVVGSASTLTGDYAGTSGAAVSMTPFTWSPTSASLPVIPLWTFVSGGLTYSFDLSALQKDFASANGLFLSGLGTARITGPGVDYLETSGHWDFTAQTFGQSSFTFSSSSLVPFPRKVADGGTTLALFGTGLCGLAFVSRRQGQTARR